MEGLIKVRMDEWKSGRREECGIGIWSWSRLPTKRDLNNI